MVLIDEMIANDIAGLWTNDDSFVNYSTGFLPLDYANGFWQLVKDGDEYKNVPVTGIIGGTIITVIGETGAGKTTFAEQIGYEIIRKFENGVLNLIDAEKTALMQRILQVTKAPPTDRRIILSKGKTTIEDTLNKISNICELKEKNKRTMMYEVTDRTVTGGVRKVYEPTVLIIDSLPSFNGKDFNVEDLGTNMDGGRGAKDVSRFFSNVLDRCWNYNITIININHIRPKMTIDPYAQPPRGLMMLNNKTETLPRGSVCQYYSHTFFRIRSNKSDAYTMADHGFTGYKATIQLAKSKTNVVGTSFPVAFISGIGFDPIYTLFEFASEYKLLQGRNPYLYLPGMEDMKFNRKDFRNLMLSNNDFKVKFILALLPYLEALLGSKESSPEEQIQESAIFDEIDELH